MKFTIAIVSYNARDYIEQCLESVINQSYKNLEIIVVDDNSSDNTVSIVKAYQARDERIKLFVHTENRSALQARKTAVRHATSEYIWFIDSDDRIDDLGAIGILDTTLKKDNYPDMLCFGSNDYYENGELKRVFYDWGRNRPLVEWKFDSDFRPYTRITRTSVLEKATKVIPDDLYLYRHNDLFMFCLVKLFTSSKAFIEKSLYRYTLSSGSVTNQKDINSITRHADLLDKLLAEYKRAASKVSQDDVRIEDFVNKEYKKLIKYALGQYCHDPKLYLHSLKSLYKNQNKVVVSLTTYNQRILTVHKVIGSLLKQSVAVDKIILWLDEAEITYKQLPDSLKSLTSELFEIKFCTNIKSYKKLIPTLKLHPNSTIITVDDDIDYPHDQLEKLLLAHYENPECIITNVARNILTNHGKLLPYREWHHAFKEQVNRPHLGLMPIGVGGVLYPPKSFHADVFKVDVFMRLAPHGDDLWFKSMTLLNDRKVVTTGESYELKPRQIGGTADVGLWQQVNKGTDSNVEQLQAILKHYPTLNEKVFGEKYNVLTITKVDLVNFYKIIKPLREKSSTKFNAKDARKLLDAINGLELAESTPSKRITKDNTNIELLSQEARSLPLARSGAIHKEALTSSSNNSFSIFELANKLYRNERFYEAASLYSYLNTLNPGFRYYKANYELAREVFEHRHNGKLKVRWDKNIKKPQYDLAALDIIYNAEEEKAESFVLKSLAKLKYVQDSHLLMASIERGDRDKWLENINKWLESYGFLPLAYKKSNGSMLAQLARTKVKEVIDGPLVTIFISAYNAEETVSYAIDSILEQSYKSFELIIIDDKSSDRTANIVTDFAKKDQRIKCHINKINRGTYANRNIGLNMAKGKYFTVMDADDYALPERITTQVKELESKNNNRIGVIGDWVRVRPDGLFGCRHTWTSSYMQPAVATLMFERDVIVKKIGFFDEVRFGADTEYFERIKKAFGKESILSLKRPLCLSAWLPSSLTACSTNGIDFILGTSPVRLKYNESWKEWHNRTNDLYIPNQLHTSERKFFAPNVMI